MNDCNDELSSCTSLCTLDEKQTTFLSVSVTYKPQENSETENNSENEISGKSKEEVDHGKKHSVQEEEYFCNSEDKGSPSSTLDSVNKVTEVKTKNEGAKTEILSGWKGYSNNIYIQPIIVNTSKNHENCSCPESSRSQKVTAEDLRKQLRLRQASEWVTKNHQRIQLKGSLKTGVPNVNPRNPKSLFISRCPSTTFSENTSAFEGNNKFCCPQQKHSRQTSKLAKGFVCRHWARDFLTREHESQTEEETSFLTIRSYVSVQMSHPGWKTTKAHALQHKKGVNLETTNVENVKERQSPENAIVSKNTQPCDHEEGHQESRRSSLSSSVSSIDTITKENLQKDMTDLIFRTMSINVNNPCRDLSCTCRNENEEAIQLAPPFKAKSGKERAKSRNSLKPNQERKILTPVPVKEFPPIDPLRGLKISPKTKMFGNRKTPSRPHTVSPSFSLIQQNISKKERLEITRVSSSRSLGNRFHGVHVYAGKAVK